MKLIDLVPILSNNQDVIVLYMFDARRQNFEQVGEYKDIKDMPLLYAYAEVDKIIGFNAEGYDGLKILLSR